MCVLWEAHLFPTFFPQGLFDCLWDDCFPASCFVLSYSIVSVCVCASFSPLVPTVSQTLWQLAVLQQVSKTYIDMNGTGPLPEWTPPLPPKAFGVMSIFPRSPAVKDSTNGKISCWWVQATSLIRSYFGLLTNHVQTTCRALWLLWWSKLKWVVLCVNFKFSRSAFLWFSSEAVFFIILHFRRSAGWRSRRRRWSVPCATSRQLWTKWLWRRKC